MDDLTKSKREIVEKHQETVLNNRSKINYDILTLLEKALENNNIDTSVHESFLDKIAAWGRGQVNKETGKKMDGAQQLEFAKLYFHELRSMMDTTSNDLKNSGYDSLIKNIDDQLQLMMDEIRQIDKELKEVTDEERRKELRGEREEIRKLA